jgi:hypothetical protein
VVPEVIEEAGEGPVGLLHEGITAFFGGGGARGAGGGGGGCEKLFKHGVRAEGVLGGGGCRQSLQLRDCGCIGVRLTLCVIPEIDQEAGEGPVGLLHEGINARVCVWGGGAAGRRAGGTLM